MSTPAQRPIGAEIMYLDAYGKNPVKAKIKKYHENSVLVEDVRGVVHYGGTWRIRDIEPAADPLAGMFD